MTMASYITSCLKPSSSPLPPAPTPSSPLTKPNLIPWPTSKETSWQNRCASTAACFIIGSTLGFAVGDVGIPNGDLWAVMQPEAKAVHWSDQRKCPPWNSNYLEKSMPENLPRPYTRGKTDGFVNHQESPAIGSPIRYNSGCFSL